MKDVFLFSLNAVMPILILMCIGYFLRRMGFLSESFLKMANRLVFRLGLPVLLFQNVYSLSGLGAINWATVAYAVVLVLVLFVLGGVIARLCVADRRRRGVLWQCSFRSNLAVIGLPLAESLGGLSGVASVSITNAFTIPLFNVLAVLALSAYVSDSEESTSARLRGIGKKVLTNPLIIGVALGFVCLGIRALLPTGADGSPIFSLQRDLPFLYTAIKYLAQLATPLALLVLGGQFRFDVVGGMKKEIVLGTAMRVLVAPLVGIGAAVILTKHGVLSFHAGDFAALTALYGSPVAVSSAVMASEMGNDEQLAGQYVVWTSIFSMLTIFLTVALLRGFAIL